MFIEAVPDGILDTFKGIKIPEAFEERMRITVGEHFPEIAARITSASFGLIDEQAYLQTVITSIIHRPHVMENHTFILGCGDSVFLTDPITGQGCNMASYAAEQIYETLVTNQEAAWDEAVGAAYWNRVKAYIVAVTEWTNAMTQPLPEHIAGLLMKAAADQQTADEIVAWFEDPIKAREAFLGNSINPR